MQRQSIFRQKKDGNVEKNHIVPNQKERKRERFEFEKMLGVYYE